MRLTAQPLDLRLATPFRISRGVQTHARNLLIAVEHEGVVGYGEAAPDGAGYYGEKRETMLAALPYFEDVLGDDPFQIEDITARLDKALHHGHGALKAAIDMALHDLTGKLLGQPACRLLGLDPARTPVSSYTIAIDAPAVMAEKARAAAPDFPILKIKVGTPDDLTAVRAIREVTEAIMRVDANAAWTPKQAIRAIERLAEFGIEFVEQPVAAHDLEGLRLVRERSPVPIIADESCVTLYDLPNLVGRVDGINIKLAKCGGMRNALKLIHAAHAFGLSVMLGCMIGSSLSMAAAAHLSPLVEYADLDGGLLLADDPFAGLGFDRGKLILSDAPGLGVTDRRPPANTNAD
jgi:L-alanine-DL-glutamate epimerase-like enolase superfamily enzyme